MRVAILSDLHGNWDALAAFTAAGERFDQIWVLGDLVNYGPQPNEVVAWVAAHAAQVVCGNHDRALGFGEDPRCSLPYRQMASEMAAYTASVLTPAHRNYLRGLPSSLRIELEGRRFYLCHATPSDPLYGYCLADSPHWEREFAAAGCDILLAGHTHLPFVRAIGGGTVANPGSLGQPKAGSPAANYAIWSGRGLELRSLDYPWPETVAKLAPIPLSAAVRADLADGLRTGRPIASPASSGT